MNEKPISQARDPDLRLSLVALQRAAMRAREIAEKTGTPIVVSRNGMIEYLQPQSMQAVGVQESSSSYGTNK